MVCLFYTWLILMVNVGKYTRHGCYGILLGSWLVSHEIRISRNQSGFNGMSGAVAQMVECHEMFAEFHVIWYHYDNMKNFGWWRIIITYIPFRRFDEDDIILIYNLWWEQKLPKLTGNSPKESSPTPRWLRKMGLQGWINLKPWNFARVSKLCSHVYFPSVLSSTLGGGFRYCLFSSLTWGNDLIFDEHIFQMGWNHQPEQHFHFIFPIFDLPHQLSQLHMKKLAFKVVRKTDESQAQRESLLDLRGMEVVLCLFKVLFYFLMVNQY